VDKLEPSRPLSLTSTIGGRNPAHATAVGKALLAWTYPTENAVAGWIDRHGPLVRRTPRTIVEPGGLVRELARIRTEGFAKDLEESEPGVRCIAASVFYGGVSPIAAISISAPKERLPNGTMPEVAALLVRETSSVAVP